MNAFQAYCETGSSASAIPYHEKALEYGLPEDEELEGRVFLAEGYLEVVGNSDVPSEEKAKLPEARRAMDQLESAVAIDQKGGYGFFEKRLNRVRLGDFNVLYSKTANAIGNDKGWDAAIAFIELKLDIFRYLSSTPMIYLLEYQSDLLLGEGQKDAAKKCLQTILAASPVAPIDEQGIALGPKEKNLKDRVLLTLQSLESGGALAESPELPKSPLAAKAGLTFAIVGLFFGGIVLGPVAMFLGFRAISQITSAKAVKGKNMAVAALIIGGLATMVSLISIIQLLLRH
jgi:tetratricopeptide (TPR) repeat protein